jgi:predicted nucleotidyltransferase component of viral defense system
MASEILSPLQRAVLDALFRDPWFRDHFYLTGGTVLAAFYLFHRRSDDLDLFSHAAELEAVEALARTVEKNAGLSMVQRQKSPQFRRYQVNGQLQVDFVVDVPFRVESPRVDGLYVVDSLKNIAVNKVCAILGRLDPKDYVDLYFIVKDKGLDVLELIRLAAQKDAGMDPFVWASLVGTAELPMLPMMIRPVTLDELHGFYRQLRDRILDAIKPP